MNKSTSLPLNRTVRLLLTALLALALTLGTGQTAQALEAEARSPVNLGAAAHYAVLTKTGITNVPASAITGDLGASPIAATAITGFSLILDPSGTFSRSSQVTGKIYAANYKSPTPSNLTTAVSNMQTAYTDAAGRTLPDHTELYAGNLSGRTLAPGLYKWSSGVLITTNVTLAGPADAVWIFQIAGNLTIGSGAKVLLSGGARPSNIFWQVGGGVGVEVGTTAHVEGTLLALKAIHLRTGASLNGRAMSQTAVTLAKNRIVIPATDQAVAFSSVSTYDGWILESGENSGVGGVSDSTSTTFVVGDNANNKQYRAILHFDTSRLPDNAVITKVTIKILKQSQAGTNPFSVLNLLQADIRKPFYGTSASLQPSDFQASSSSATVATFGSTAVNNWYSANLTATGRSFINRSGTTQFRLRFSRDDNNNHAADYLKFYSGNASSAMRPQLIVTYYIP